MPPTPKAEPADAGVGTGPLHDRLARVMEQTSRLPKDQTHPHFGYRYTGVESIMEAVNKALAREKVILIPRPLGWERRESEPPRNKPTMTTFLHMQYTFECVNDEGAEESLSVEWHSEADDQQDKGLAKAYTAARKTFLRDFFLISTGDDDPDRDHAPGSEASGEPARQQATRGAVVTQKQRNMLYAKTRAALGGPDAASAEVEQTLADLVVIASNGKVQSVDQFPGSKKPVDALISWIDTLAANPAEVRDAISSRKQEHPDWWSLGDDAGTGEAIAELDQKRTAAADDDDIPF